MADLLPYTLGAKCYWFTPNQYQVLQQRIKDKDSEEGLRRFCETTCRKITGLEDEPPAQSVEVPSATAGMVGSELSPETQAQAVEDEGNGDNGEEPSEEAPAEDSQPSLEVK
jgi:hypothetical protein